MRFIQEWKRAMTRLDAELASIAQRVDVDKKCLAACCHIISAHLCARSCASYHQRKWKEQGQINTLFLHFNKKEVSLFLDYLVELEGVGLFSNCTGEVRMIVFYRPLSRLV